METDSVPLCLNLAENAFSAFDKYSVRWLAIEAASIQGRPNEQLFKLHCLMKFEKVCVYEGSNLSLGTMQVSGSQLCLIQVNERQEQVSVRIIYAGSTEAFRMLTPVPIWRMDGASERMPIRCTHCSSSVLAEWLQYRSSRNSITVSMATEWE